MGLIGDLVFFRRHHVCPRWFCFVIDNFLRRWIQNPGEIIKAYVQAGDCVVDVGAGIGYFTLPLAQLVGDEGRVIAVDVQQAMLAGIEKRARRAGVLNRVSLRLAGPASLNVVEKADFILAFWMAHEVPDQEGFFNQLFAILKKGGTFLLVEPKLHVTTGQFALQVAQAQKAGFRLLDHPPISLSQAALFISPGGDGD